MFGCWRWCPANDVGFVDNCLTFWGRQGLIRRDSTRSILDGSTLISRNLDVFISKPKPQQPRVETRRQSCSLTHFSVLPLEQLSTPLHWYRDQCSACLVCYQGELVWPPDHLNYLNQRLTEKE